MVAAGGGTERATRELLIARRVAMRVNVLQQLPAHIMMSEDIRTDALVELRSLKLLRFQQQVRSSVVTQLTPDQASVRFALRRGAHQAPRYQLMRDAEQTELIEKQRQEDRAAAKKMKHTNYLSRVLQHGRRFHEWHAHKYALAARIAKHVTNSISHSEKAQAKAQELSEKERMRMLQQNDEAGYRALIDKQKNKRLAYLLDKTDEFMKQMLGSITVHQDEEDQRDAKEKESKRKKVAAEKKVAAADARKVADAAAEAALEAGGDPEAEKAAAVAADAASVAADAAAAASASVGAGAARGGGGAAAGAAGGTGGGGAAGEAAPPPTGSMFGQAHKKVEVIKKQPSILVNGTLKEYQITGLEWMVSMYNNKLNGILADEMGLGKTIQTIALFTHLIEHKGENGPFMVMVPLSTLSNWVNEFAKWAPSVITMVYNGSPAVRKGKHDQIRLRKFNVMITTYDYVMKDKGVLGKLEWRYIVIDEGHRIKNAKGKLTQVLADAYKSRRRILLTGTPLQNNLPELWALLNFLLPTIFKSSETFEQWFSAPFSGTAEKIEMNEEEKLLVIQRLHKVLRPFVLRRLKREVLKQLPQKVEVVLKCEMSAVQRRLYTHMKKYGVLLTEDANEEENAKKGAGVKSLQNTIMQLRKICNHPFIFRAVDAGILSHLQARGDDITDISQSVDFWRSCGKFELLNRIMAKLEATGHRCLIFCQMTELMSVLEDFLISRGTNYLRLDGSTKADERGNLLKIFNAPDSIYTSFMLSTRAGGLGLNLQTADTVIIFDSDWNPHQDLQAQDRAHRIGQKNEVRVYRLVTVDSVEENILETARYKLSMDNKVIQAGMFNHQSNASTQRDYLQQILEKEDDDDATTEEKVENDAEMNLMIARGQEEVRIFGEMDLQRAQDDKSWMDGTIRRKRLMEKHELPNYMNVTDAEMAKIMDQFNPDNVDIATLGRGRRARADVTYADELSEEQWLRAVDNGDSLDEARSKARTRRGEAGPDQDAALQAMQEHYGVEGEEGEEGGGRSNRGRRRGAASADDDGAPPKSKRRKRAERQEETAAALDAVLAYAAAGESDDADADADGDGDGGNGGNGNEGEAAVASAGDAGDAAAADADVAKGNDAAMETTPALVTQGAFAEAAAPVAAPALTPAAVPTAPEAAPAPAAVAVAPVPAVQADFATGGSMDASAD